MRSLIHTKPRRLRYLSGRQVDGLHTCGASTKMIMRSREKLGRGLSGCWVRVGVGVGLGLGVGDVDVEKEGGNEKK